MYFQAMQYVASNITLELLNHMSETVRKGDQRLYRKAVQETICIYIDQLHRDHIFPLQ